MFVGYGREAIADTLKLANPFGEQPATIVECVLALRHVADPTKPRRDLWPTVGQVSKVRHNGQDFLVAVDWKSREISVQEIRADPYMPIK